MKTKICFAILFCLSLCSNALAQVDYSVLSVDEEAGTEFTQMTTDAEYVCMPEVRRRGARLEWYTNKIIAISPDGKKLAFLSSRNDATNIYIKDIGKKGGSIKRTNRQRILDFSYAPDGESICFTESDGYNCNQIFQTNANVGYVCRQITNGSLDYSPVYSKDMKNIYFVRQEREGASIWSYNVADNFLSNYTRGMNPEPSKQSNEMFCTRFNSEGRGEIWRVDIKTGIEECILSDAHRSFSTPSVSPNGQWILLVGSNVLANGKQQYANTDIFVCRLDGTNVRQLTYHAADDLSPIWDNSGKYIYFVSQRGSADATACVWRMTFIQ